MQVMNKSNQIQDKNKNKKSVTVLATICIMVAFALVASPIIITKNAFSFDELKREIISNFYELRISDVFLSDSPEELG
jgi:hypothetical protein